MAYAKPRINFRAQDSVKVQIKRIKIGKKEKKDKYLNFGIVKICYFKYNFIFYSSSLPFCINTYLFCTVQISSKISSS